MIKLKQLINQRYSNKVKLDNSQLSIFQIGQDQLDVHFSFNDTKLAKYAKSYINNSTIKAILQKNLNSQFKLNEFGIKGSVIVVILNKKGIQEAWAKKAYTVFLELLKVVQQSLRTANKLAKM